MCTLVRSEEFHINNKWRLKYGTDAYGLGYVQVVKCNVPDDGVIGTTKIMTQYWERIRDRLNVIELD
jgi:hypothetical protein